ncbi:hypothetical protein ACFSTH_16080 [Paenibacillus yanchengensis]|uniref:Small EDRK-rich factor-like N-terminal domain-containing protein n=1 Tax=Paenibacillus yanchengensis TaxID=2035833 RepID=A0ABW4YH35_9BACL
MSEQAEGTNVEQTKVLSQAERAKQLLAQKKQAKSGNAKGQKNLSTETKELRSQNTKKVNNQRKKMGV